MSSTFFMIINVLPLIQRTSAEFNLNSLDTTTNSLDTINQNKITLNTTWDLRHAKDDDPITLAKIQQTQQQHNATEDEKILLNTTTIKRLIKYLSNQKPLKTANMIKQQQEPKNNHERNPNHFYHYLTTLQFNKGNNPNNHDNFNLNNKLKTIITYTKHDDDAKDILQNLTLHKENPAEQMLENKEAVDNFKLKYKTKYYVPANSLSNDWLGQMPQFQLQTQQLQLFLQQQTLRQTSSVAAGSLLSMAAASLLPHEYHHLTDYSLFFNARHHTHFYLHTLTAQKNFVTVATKQATEATKATATVATIEQQPDGHNRYKKDYNYNYENPNSRDNDYESNNNNDADMHMLNLINGRNLNAITDTIGAAFGVNTRPVAAIHGIHIEEIELYNGLSLRQSRFNPFNPCRILIHGWLGGSKAGMYNTLVPEYFKLQQGAYNIFTVDWGKGAMADYITASYRVKAVGIIVAKFIDFLHQESGIPFENMHVIGFSMGAHIAGIAGKYVQAGRLPVIYGLDPALPLFRYGNVNERLDAGDANYVEVIHTSVGSYGYDHPLGHVDFYVNFGYNQPGCFFNECSHLRAFKIFAQSLANEILKGEECLEELWWDMIKHKRCSRQMARSLRMGVEGLTGKEMSLRRGLYYVITNAQPPYRIS